MARNRRAFLRDAAAGVARLGRAARISSLLAAVLPAGGVLLAPSLSAQPQAGRAPAAVSAEDFLAVAFPTALTWSPDGRHLAYRLTDDAGNEIRVYDAEAGLTRRLVRDLPLDRYYYDRPDLRWSSDGQRVVYRSGREYFTVSAAGGEPDLLVSGTLLGELVQLSPDQRTISFVRDGDIWTQPVDGTEHPRRLTQGQGFLSSATQFFSRLQEWPQWSPDGSRITFLAPTAAGVRVGVVRVRDGHTAWVVPPEDVWTFTRVAWSPTGDRLAISRMSRDFQRKQLVVARPGLAEEEVVWEDTDDRWVSHNVLPHFHVDWAPDGRRVAFLSNRGGWHHLYVATPGSDEPRQLTRGEYETFQATWSPDGRHILAIANRSHLQQRLPWLVDAQNGKITRLVSDIGTAIDVFRGRVWTGPAWSPSGERIAYVFSGPSDPVQIRIQQIAAGRAPTVVYSTVGERLDAGALPTMETVSYRADDGTSIPALLLGPRALDEDRSHPGLIHMYGGWGQMAAVGWGLGIKAKLLNYLAHRGYVVLIVDPRGSEGYGDEYAKGLYREGGGLQARDLIAGARYLARSGVVDPDGIAIYGHSYGAYLALQTMLTEPGVFAAGVLQAGVFEWGRYGSSYGTYQRIRFGSPYESPSLLDLRGRPARHVDQLEGSVLVLHGTGDFNAPPSASELLVDELLRAGKDFEYMSYPGEPHSWIRPETKRDFFRRVERFLDRTVRH